MESGIYEIVNLINNKRYIGSTKKFRKRELDHLYLLRLNKHHSIYLQRAWNKYGKENFKFRVLLKCPTNKEYLLRLEQWFLDNYKPEYNCLPNAKSRLGTKVSEDSKKKMSISHIGKKYINRKKYIFTEEHLNKIRESLSKPEVKFKLQQNAKKIGLKYGISDKARNAMLEKIRRPVLQFDMKNNFIKEWNSLSEACRFYNIRSSHMCGVCMGKKKYKSAKGFIWKYKFKEYTR